MHDNHRAIDRNISKIQRNYRTTTFIFRLITSTLPLANSWLSLTPKDTFRSTPGKMPNPMPKLMSSERTYNQNVVIKDRSGA